MSDTQQPALSVAWVRHLLEEARKCRVLVVGDVMLDQFIWGRVNRISPEAPVPVVDFDHESFMPGGAANVARNLTTLGVPAELFSVVGQDDAGQRLKRLLEAERVACDGCLERADRSTSIKTRIIAHQQQMVRVDRETRGDLDMDASRELLTVIEAALDGAAALIVGDYGKGLVTQWLLDELKPRCRERGIWISFDPKPIHHLKLSGLSLVTPNRKETFELAGALDSVRAPHPLEDGSLLAAAERLLADFQPDLLLVTLGEQGMLLCRKGHRPAHIPTVAREVFDVSGAGDTVIASFTLAIAAGASPIEAAVFSNHAAGVVVGKVGTAAVNPGELIESFKRHS